MLFMEYCLRDEKKWYFTIGGKSSRKVLLTLKQCGLSGLVIRVEGFVPYFSHKLC